MAIVASAVAGVHAMERATILQLRAPGLSTAELEREASALVASASIPVLVSSRCDVALACDAAGVNLPERDLAIRDARTLLGGRLIGRSVHSIEGAQEAELDGADYVIYGPVWPSASHPRVARVARLVRIPVLAIGGVTDERIADVHAAGAGGFAAIGMFS
jgi:thiamine-phosphate diphosphorylase